MMKITVTTPVIVEKDLDVFGITNKKKMRAMMKKIGETQTKRIQQRTKKSVDVHGNKFAPLSKMTAMAAKPRPKIPRGVLSDQQRGRGRPLYQTGKMFLNKMTHREQSSGTMHSTTIFVRDVGVTSDDGRKVRSVAVASAHNNGHSYPAMFKSSKNFRIPIKMGKRSPARDIGIITQAIRPRRLPKREFMGISTSEVNGLYISITGYLKTGIWKRY